MAVEASRATTALKPGGLDPLRFAWQLLTNVKFALVLVGTAAFAGFLGVILPQMPGPMRDNAAARDAWLQLQRESYGALTTPMERLGLFDVFHTTWFNGLWLVIIVAVTVCTVSRFRPTWRSVTRPPKVAGDGYFRSAHHHASFSFTGGAEAVEGLLRKKRYRVQRTKETPSGETYLFAERFSWSQYGTFLSHLALLMLLVGALLTTLAGFDRTMVLAENTPAATVFDNPGPHQIFVKMLDAVRGIDSNGNIVDFHSSLQVRQGNTVVTCSASVNTPCKAFGYKIHQAAFFNDIARLYITDGAGTIVYNNVLDFESETTAVPQFVVTDDSGALLFDQELPQMLTDTGKSAGPEDDLAVGNLAFPRSSASGDGQTVSYSVAWRVVANGLQVVLGSDDGKQLPPKEMNDGETISDGPYHIRYVGARSIPAIRVKDMPGSISDDGSAVVQMPTDPNGNPYLFVTGIDLGGPIALSKDAPQTPLNGFTYRFDGQVEASGISVKRDPGSAFIWVAVGMAVIGLAITFYVPRRRLWVKVVGGRAQLAGIAERTTRFSRELRLLGAQLGSPDALLPGDTERDG
jgi:cytochrome c biogenesis protein